MNSYEPPILRLRLTVGRRWALLSTLAAGVVICTAAIATTQQLPGDARQSSDESGTTPRRPREGSDSNIQFRRSSGRGGARREPSRSDYETWEIDQRFSKDVFTFVRIEYDSMGTGRRGRGGGWRNDYPDCDWNFSLRLQQLTSIQVDPNGKVLRLTDPALFDHPFAYMSNVQGMNLSDTECAAFRQYLLSGGFVMADDFWAADAWRHVRSQMERVLPGRSPKELSIDHPVFHVIYNLQQLPQVPSIFAWRGGDMVERWHGSFEGDEAPHFQGYFDDSGRLMALFCHNNDIGDGWEREGENKEFFELFSEKMSYPFGINLVTYVMTH